MKVEDMPASQFLGRVVWSLLSTWKPATSWYHLLSANDAAFSSHPLNVLGRRVGVFGIHVLGRHAILEQVTQSDRERTEGRVERVYVVERNRAVEGENGVEEDGIDDQSEGI
jgi:hypothetical protein